MRLKLKNEREIEKRDEEVLGGWRTRTRTTAEQRFKTSDERRKGGTYSVYWRVCAVVMGA
jgi:hypothetical protein